MASMGSKPNPVRPHNNNPQGTVANILVRDTLSGYLSTS